MASTMLNAAVVLAMPSASVMIATTENAGERRSMRNACRMSRAAPFIMAFRREWQERSRSLLSSGRSLAAPDKESDPGQQRDHTGNGWNGDLLLLLHRRADRTDAYRVLVARIRDAAVRQPDDAEDDQDDSDDAHGILRQRCSALVTGTRARFMPEAVSRNAAPLSSRAPAA